uniref:C/EBPbeta/delta/epsilon CCAAT enhancer binding protein beta/delta/epsilon homolog n=1 Tax=Phallusia mammillata TaxID=59560 RepID=A0A6F9D8S9_9ASCI|nr:C/EBPbeta/delta/epsilon CCAAT enhancer binding protein beta/delta/epsilon homolog [Phallusia mammillata]
MDQNYNNNQNFFAGTSDQFSNNINLTVPFNEPEFKTPQDICPNPGGGKATPPSKEKIKAKACEQSEEYVTRRKRNNVAVKKSREKTKEKSMTTIENIERLKVENVDLEEKVEVLSQELTTLRKIFMDHAKGFSGGEEVPDLKQLEQLLGHKLTEGPTTSKTNNNESH